MKKVTLYYIQFLFCLVYIVNFFALASLERLRVDGYGCACVWQRLSICIPFCVEEIFFLFQKPFWTLKVHCMLMRKFRIPTVLFVDFFFSSRHGCIKDTNPPWHKLKKDKMSKKNVKQDRKKDTNFRRESQHEHLFW